MPNILEQFGLSRFLNRAPQNNDAPMEPVSAPEPISVSPPTATPQTPFTQEYMNMLNSMPNKANYKPRMLTKILGTSAGVLDSAMEGPRHGVEYGNSIIDHDYNEASSDWLRKMGNLKERAGLENQNLDNIFKARKDAREERSTDSNIGVDAARVRNYGATSAQAGAQTVKGTDGHYYRLFPDGTRRDLGKVNESVSEEDIRNLGNFRQRESISNGFQIGRMRLGSDLNTREHESNRTFDVANPVPASINPYLNPSQITIADKQALEDEVRAHPQFEPYVARDANQQITAAKFNPDAKFSKGDSQSNWNFFLSNVEKRKTELQNTTRNGAAPTVRAPQSPLNPMPKTADTALRNQAIEQIKKNYPDRPDLLTNESYIKSLIDANKAN